MIYASPNTDGAVVSFSERYDNFIGGDWVAPVEGAYFDNVSPVNGKPFCQVARSGAADIERALDAAHAAKDAWGRTSVADRANTLLKIADRVEANIERLAVAETWDNGKAVRETLNADLPLVVDHFRYFAGCIRAQEGSIGEIDEQAEMDVEAMEEQARAIKEGGDVGTEIDVSEPSSAADSESAPESK